MDHFINDSFTRIFARLQKRAIQLPKDLADKLPQSRTNLRIIISFVWIGLAILLGMYAQKESDARGVSLWMANHLPSSQVWKQLGETRGLIWDSSSMRAVSAHEEVTQLDLEIEPEEGSIWISNPAEGILFFRKEGQSEALWFQSSSDKTKANRVWEKLGVGWDGVHQLFKILEKKPLRPSLVRKKSWKDPREVSY